MHRMVAQVVVAGVLTGTTLLHAQQAGQTQAGPPVFKAGVQAVVVAASVRDGRGRIVRNLKKSDFEVIDTGFGRPITEFYSGNAPVSLAVLLDISGSMGIGGNMDRARNAVAVATTNLRDASDEAALYTFDSSLQKVVDFTKDLERIRQVSLKGTPWGITSLFDAIAETARSAAERDNRHRAVLVITDGIDTGSRLTAPEVSAIASAIDVPVYLLTVVNPLDHPGGDFEVLAADEKVAQTATLADLARWTGGDMRIVSVPEQTVEELADLFAELRHQYLIIFEPGPRPGWHPLEIRTRNRDLVVHARSGYTTVPPPSGS